VTSEQPHSEGDLTDEQKALLVAAHRRLAAANAGYERYLGAELSANEPMPYTMARPWQRPKPR
jgi:hypothetical protein